MAKRADLMRELMGTGHIVSPGITATQAGGVVQVVVLQLDERGLAAL